MLALCLITMKRHTMAARHSTTTPDKQHTTFCIIFRLRLTLSRDSIESEREREGVRSRDAARGRGLVSGGDIGGSKDGAKRTVSGVAYLLDIPPQPYKWRLGLWRTTVMSRDHDITVEASP